MKRINYIIAVIAGVFLMSSCNDWLSVTPKTEVIREKLFTTQTGFKDALTGTYIQMKESKAYGRALSMTFVENLVSFWEVSNNTAEQNLGMHNYAYADAESRIADSYQSLYRIITSANSILEYVDQRRSVFKTDGMYEIIKGEALAIRAHCHLDLLRLFGPVPSTPTQGKMLAYVTTISKIPHSYHTYDEYCKLLLKDIENSAALLKEKDPVLSDDPSAKVSESFYSSRKYRFNYYAVKGLQARANLYFGNKEMAVEAAKEIVVAVFNNGNKKFPLGQSSDFSNSDFSLSGEHLVSIYDHNLYGTYNTLYVTGTLKKGTSLSTIKSMFGNTGTDIREVNLWELRTHKNGSTSCVIKKYTSANPTDAGSGVKLNVIPLIRVSEMYLILAEATPLAEAQNYWKDFRMSRNLPVTTLTDAERQREIMSEYRKEFYAEGQMFYYHKRMNSPKIDIMWFPSRGLLNYVLPLPKTEIIQN